MKIKSSKRYISTNDIQKIFSNIGYDTFRKKKTLTKLLDIYSKSVFCQYADGNGLKLSPLKNYNTIDRNNKVCYIEIKDGETFLLKHFKKEAIKLLYSDPQAIDRKSSEYGHISFTTQSKIASYLQVSQYDVSRACKGLDKIYQHELCMFTEKYDGILFYMEKNKGKYKVVNIRDKETKVIKHYLYKLTGSKLIYNGVQWYKYEKKCGRKISEKLYQILDSCNKATSKRKTDKNEVMSYRKQIKAMNVKKEKGKCSIKEYFTTRDFNQLTVKYSQEKEDDTLNNKISLNTDEYDFLKEVYKNAGVKSVYEYLPISDNKTNDTVTLPRL